MKILLLGGILPLKKKAKKDSYLFEGVGNWSPIKFPTNSSCSHQYPIKILLFSSSSHQIPLVPINNPSISSCSHQVPEQFPSRFLLFPSSSHQNRFVPMAMEDRQVSTGERPLRCTVRDSGRVLNGAPQFVGRPEGEPQWQADVCRMRQSRKSGFSGCQVLWKIAGRSASREAVCRTSSFMCATQESFKTERRKLARKP
jgi:hypothetical protein